MLFSKYKGYMAEYIQKSLKAFQMLINSNNINKLYNNTLVKRCVLNVRYLIN